MSILDKFKKEQPKKSAAKPAAKKSAAPKAQPKEKTIREEVAASTKKSVKTVAKGMYGHRVLLRPIISEKSAYLHSFNQYVFEVSPRANKIEIKKAIIEVYHVEPVDVKIVRLPGKTVNRGRVSSRTSAYKKAIVSMPQGTELPIYEGV